MMAPPFIRHWVLLALALSSTSAMLTAVEPAKPADDAAARPYRERLEAIIKDRYPGLLAKKLEGTAVVTVLFDAAGTLINTNLEIKTHDPGPLGVSEDRFAPFGLVAGELEYIGVARVELPLNTVLVVFGAKTARGRARGRDSVPR